MGNIAHRVKGIIKPSDPIDFDLLKSETQRLGPLILSKTSDPYTVEISVVPCACAEEVCTEQLVVVWRRSGLFSIHWLLSPAELQQFETLDKFRHAVVAGVLTNSVGERQLIENEVQRQFEAPYYEIDPVTCVCQACAEAASSEQVWTKMQLSQLALGLDLRDECINYAHDNFGEEPASLISDAFDFGYFLGRSYSEYSVKRFIEPHALVGRDFEALKEKRSKAAGMTSVIKRRGRIHSLLTHMEALVEGSPALRRLDPLVLARMAYEDAAAQDPRLWAQGAGQIEEYLGLLRRGEGGPELQSRYLKLFPG